MRRFRRGAKEEGWSSMSNVQCYLLEDLSFVGPQDPSSKPYASISILDPIITVERHHGKYFVAARFNLETTILAYYENQARDGHEYFFQDVCLQYLSPRANEELSMKPESDPSAAMTITRGTETTLSTSAELSLSQTPSANVSLGLDRTKSLVVEYAVATWSLSAHRISHGLSLNSGKSSQERTTSASKTEKPPAKATTEGEREEEEEKEEEEEEEEDHLVYQWFWAGTHRETKTLTPDVKYTVKRHIVATRMIPVELFPITKEQQEKQQRKHKDKLKKRKGKDPARGPERGKDGGASSATKDDDDKEENGDDEDDEPNTASPKPPTLQDLLSFSFRVQVRVKKRFGRLHRTLVLSGNELKGKILKPACEQSFRLVAEPDWIGLPLTDTPNINALLSKAKHDFAGQYSDLQDKSFFEISGAYVVTEAERIALQKKELEREQAMLERRQRMVTMVSG